MCFTERGTLDLLRRGGTNLRHATDFLKKSVSACKLLNQYIEAGVGISRYRRRSADIHVDLVRLD